MDLQAIVRPNIWKLKPYRCARDDYQDGILLDANENSLGPSIKTSMDLNRYPDPHQADLKALIAKFRGVKTENLFIGVGSDESIDLIIRIFCVPAKDKVLICPPTYGMYAVCCQVNDVETVKVELTSEYQLNVAKIKETLAADASIKVVFLCSPGNPTGISLNLDDIKQLLEFKEFKGVIVVDEAYIDFAKGPSACTILDTYPNLIITQTLSKAFGLAGIRLGISIASKEISEIFNKTKAPYNIATPTSQLACSAFTPENLKSMKSKIDEILKERQILVNAFPSIPNTGKLLGGWDSNFLLLEILNPKTGKPDNKVAHWLYQELAERQGVVVRFRGTEPLCNGCLRITVGTKEENQTLIEKMKMLLSNVPEEVTA